MGAPPVSADSYADYVRRGQDPGLLFHTGAGAEIVEPIAGYRPAYADNFGHAVLVRYALNGAATASAQATQPTAAPADLTAEEKKWMEKKEKALREAEEKKKLLAKIAARNGLQDLSMGMSSDFEKAIALGATHVRVGSAIFGERTAG